MRSLMISLLASSLLWGCVSSGKYDGLKAKYDNAQAQLGERGNKIKSLEQALVEREQLADKLQGQITQKQAELQRRQDELATLDLQCQEISGHLSAQTAESTSLRTQLAELVKDRSRLKESTAQLSNALLTLAQNKEAADRRVAEYRGLLTRFKSLIDAGHLSVKIVDGRMVLALPSDVLFDSGSAKLSSTGRQTVLSVASVLSSMSGKSFQIEGHTDNVPISTARFASNWELASARALVVLKAMVEAGMPSRVLSAASYGEFHPVASNESEPARAGNRRIEIILVPDMSTVPGSEELQRAVSAR